MPENAASLPDFTRWPSFPFEGDMRVKDLAAPVAVEPPRSGEDASDCVACSTPDDAYIWENERWRVRAMDRPTGLPMVLILECRSHLDMGDLPNLLAAELGVMTVRLERAIRSLDGVARVHVNRWGDGSAHLHMWFLARPYGRLQLRGTFLSLWDDILPTIPEDQWRENLALVAAWLAEFGGHANTEPAHIQWQSPSTFSVAPLAAGPGTEYAAASNVGPTESATASEDATVATESAILTDSIPARDANLGSADTDPTAATDQGSAGVSPDLEESVGDGSRTGSGSDHTTGFSSDLGSASDSEGDPAAGASETKGSEVTESSAEIPLAADAGADSGKDAAAADTGVDSGEPSVRSDGPEVSLADDEKDLWRPSNLGDSKRPVSAAGATSDPSPAAGATVGGSEDRQAGRSAPDSDDLGGDGNDAGPDIPLEQSAFSSQKDTEAQEPASTAEAEDRASSDAMRTSDDQTDASAETAGTLRT